MTTIYIKFETLLDNYRTMPALLKSKVSSAKNKFHRISERYAGDGELSSRDKKLMIDRFKELLVIGDNNHSIYKLIEVSYPSLDNRLAIFREWILKTQRVGWALHTVDNYFHDTFLRMCVDRYNIVVNLLTVIRNTYASKEEFTRAYSNEACSNIYRTNNVISELIGERFELMSDIYDSTDYGYHLAHRDRCYSILKAKYHQYFDDVVDIHVKTVDSGDYDRITRSIIIEYVITTISRDYGITPSLDGVVMDIEEHVDNYVKDNFIYDLGLKAV